MAGILAAAVHLNHPVTGERLILLPGDEVQPEIAELITHPDAFLPAPDPESGPEPEAGTSDSPPAKPTRARKARIDTE
ncbi:hypothetical protein [Kitasatospora griseola]|uniref:hypothetical protein n=1 Tax=Kitasatospora griseola TaxID=2064 RepID=UPI00382490BF